MTRLLLALPLLLTAGCGHNLLQPGPPRQPAWRATGMQPFWEVLIQDGVIAFRPAPDGRGRTWRAVRPRVRGDVTIWRTGHSNQGIEIIAHRTGCSLPGAGRDTRLNYEQSVTVRLGREGPQFLGCGGRIFAISSGSPRR